MQAIPFMGIFCLRLFIFNFFTLNKNETQGFTHPLINQHNLKNKFHYNIIQSIRNNIISHFNSFSIPYPSGLVVHVFTCLWVSSLKNHWIIRVNQQISFHKVHTLSIWIGSSCIHKFVGLLT